ncbi:unnamed protein product, partial [Porites lobata]
SLESVSIDNEYDYENEILPLTIMRMRSAQNTCSTRSGNSFHDEISSKTRSAKNEFLKASFKTNQPETIVRTNQVCHIKRSHCLHKPKNYGLTFQSFYALSVYVSGKENFLYGSSYSYVLLTHFLQARQRVRVRDGLVLVLVLVVNANTL